MHLVTGGAGFIGSHLVNRLVGMGQRVRVLDNFSSGKKDNLSDVENKIELIVGDILDPEALKKAMTGAEVVFHQAALRSVPFSVENPVLVNRVNVEGTLNVLTAALQGGVRRVVYASSSSVYGNGNPLPLNEDQPPHPLSPYAASKLAGEHYCRIFTGLYGLQTVSLRYFNVFGPRQDPTSLYAAVIPRFIHSALRGEPLEIHGDGLQSRDFTYVDNVVSANLLAAYSRHAIGGVFNIGQGRDHTLLDFIKELQRVLGVEVRWVHTESRAGDVRHTRADLTRAERDLAYGATVTFEEGVAKTAASLNRPYSFSRHERPGNGDPVQGTSMRAATPRRAG